MDPILDGLNPAQHAAVTSPERALQVLAPPGSGKTKTLTSRVAYMLREFKFKPWNIVCLTFTIKSAKEMKDRIAKLIGNGLEKRLILGTFHSVCLRYLAAYGHLIGIQKNFGIADSTDGLNIIRRLVERLKLQTDPKIAQSRISRAKSKGLSCQDLELKLKGKKDVEQQEIIIVFDSYQRHLQISNLLDYDDLLVRCTQLLQQHPECVSNVEAVLVDEFQDTNVVQFDLLRLFAFQQKRVTTVGDPDQSIYGWRSAETANLERLYLEYPEAVVVNLEENYRSSAAILLAAQEVIEQDELRPQKRISPTHCPGSVPVLRAIPSADAEASWTVSEIVRVKSLTGNLLEYGDFAILLRSASLSRLIESALGRAGIPYRMVGGQRFFDRLEVKILLDYLRVVSQPSNNDALIRIINVPPRGIGPATVKALVEEAELKRTTLWDFTDAILKGNQTSRTKLSKVAQQNMGVLYNLVMTTRNKFISDDAALGPRELLGLLIMKLDYQSFIKKSHPEDFEARWANVEELGNQASEFPVLAENFAADGGDDSLPIVPDVDRSTDNAAGKALSDFLANVALATELQQENADESGDALRSPVTISTIHAAKGLEFPVVFIPSTYSGIIPHSRAEDTDEERRLLYVAMTRAQSLLYMSSPLRNSQKDDVALSPFVSTKKVKQYLCNRGPTIDHTAVADIARILRRPCPSPMEIEKACEGLRSRNDDVWPLTGKNETGEGKAKRSEYGEYEFSSRKINDTRNGAQVQRTKDRTTIGYATTMQDQASFTFPGSNAGFSTASTQLRLEQTQASSDRMRHGEGADLKGADHIGRKAKANHLKQPNGNLLSYWVPESRENRCNTTAQVVIQAESGQRVARRPLMDLSSVSAANGLAGLKRTRDEKSVDSGLPDAEQGVILLSSSPTDSDQRVEWDHDRSDGLPSLSKRLKASRSPHKFNSSGTSPPDGGRRKTLGVRRSMDGWSRRANHE